MQIWLDWRTALGGLPVARGVVVAKPYAVVDGPPLPAGQYVFEARHRDPLASAPSAVHLVP
eukprot:669114-Heterocapsa_arctica.AAC.1